MKKIVLTAVASLMLVFSAKAQVFVMEEDGNNRAGTSPVEFIVPDHFENDDQTPGENGDDPVPPHAPLGSGVIVLAGLGGAYLLGKKRKK